MKKILIDKEIGGLFGLYSDDLRRDFDCVSETEDVEIVIDSPGGDFYEMVGMYNVIRDFARAKKQNVKTYIQGMAASAASMLALAAKDGNCENEIIVEDNSVFMIHNCWSVGVGDCREFEKLSKATARIDELQRDIYQRKTKKDRLKLKQMMDDATFLYGSEIVEEGFADRLIQGEKSADENDVFSSGKSAAIISAKCAFDSMKKKMCEAADKNKEKISARFESIDSLLKTFDTTTFESSQPIKPEVFGKKTEDSSMTKEELKAKEPALYDEIYNDGVKAERSRVEAHLKMAKDSGDISAAVEFISDGKNCSDNAVIAKYHEVFTKTKLAQARLEDNVGNMAIPATKLDDGEKASVEAFLRETGLN